MGSRSLSSLAASLGAGTLTLEEYLEWLEARHLEREPELLSFMAEEGRFERLRQEARRLVETFPEPTERPPLFGVPVGVKDIFHVDGFVTTGGSRLPPSELAGPESEAVARLKAAGCLILGKTVTTEFAYFAPGPTRNPHDPERTPGGSSSGSAAAVGAGLAPLTLGTQTIGSISRPASYCGVVGYKPSYDRISRAGVIPLAPSVDHIGFFTPDVEGGERVAAVLCQDWRGAQAGELPVLAVPEGPYLDRAEEETRDWFEQICRRLGNAGYRVERVPAMTDFDRVYELHQDLVAAETAAVHREWYAHFNDLYHFKTAGLIDRGKLVSRSDLEVALAGRQELRAAMENLADDAGVDLWISPAAPGVAPVGLQSTGDPVMNLPWTHSGLPTLTVPGGTIAGLPMGLQCAGRWWTDESLFSWGRGIEQALR